MLDVVKFEKNPRLRTFMSATQLTAPSVFTNHTTLNVWGDLLMVPFFWRGLTIAAAIGAANDCCADSCTERLSVIVHCLPLSAFVVFTTCMN